MEVSKQDEVDGYEIPDLSLFDKVRGGVTVIAGIGALGLGAANVTGGPVSKVELLATIPIILQGIPSLNRIDAYHRQIRGI